MGAVALREERQSLTIDSPEAIADLCSEMRFLDRESLRVILLNTKQQLIKVATVSQGSVNESLAHPREVFKPAIVLSAYSFIMVHNHPSRRPLPFRSGYAAHPKNSRSQQNPTTPIARSRHHWPPARAGVAISVSRKGASFHDSPMDLGSNPARSLRQ